MDSLRDRMKRKKAGEMPSSRPTRIGPTKKEISVRQMLEDGAREFLKNVNLTAAAFPGGQGAGGGGGGGSSSSTGVSAPWDVVVLDPLNDFGFVPSPDGISFPDAVGA